MDAKPGGSAGKNCLTDASQPFALDGWAIRPSAG
jgi:hypothetical protein